MTFEHFVATFESLAFEGMVQILKPEAELENKVSCGTKTISYWTRLGYWLKLYLNVLPAKLSAV